jgi:hypothetical protein
MEPVEINAGACYLRALRCDERIDDRPALAEMGITDPGHVAVRRAQWADDAVYSWAVCEPTTGELLAEVTLTPSTGIIATQARPGGIEAARRAAEVVRRFGQPPAPG